MIIKKEIYRRIFKIIKKYDTIVLARHISPDPDAIASQIALRDSIRETFPNKKVYAVGAGVNKFKYLGNLDRIDSKELHEVLLIVLDVPNFCRVDGIEDLDYKAILKIDHHPVEDIVGDVDYTEVDRSSTCEMIAELIMNTNLVLTKSIAQALYIGIISDSERFLLSNTSVNTLRITTELLETSKIDFISLHDLLYERSIVEDKFRAYLTNNLEITENKFGFIFVTNDVLKEYGVEATTVSSQVNNFYHLKELLCWMFVVYDERNEIYKANIRSCGPVINEVTAKFGGGGHKFASGCRTKEYETIEDLAKNLDEVCKEYLDALEK
jgi:phosphoesterase RecJ-like protein